MPKMTVIMIRIRSKIFIFSVLLGLLLSLVGMIACTKIDNQTLPAYTVRIDLGTYAMWNTYGVAGVGDSRLFDRTRGIPSNFPFTVNTFTGFGGVILIMGLDPTTGGNVPLAYDASCPVERSSSTTLSIDPTSHEAVCSVCHSHFNVLTGRGGPISGQALTTKKGMTTYVVRYSPNGGYYITNR